MELILEITDLARSGAGLGRDPKGRVVFVPFTAPGDRVRVVLRNPYRPENDHHSGNRMALANIRERLQLHFDAEASIKTVAGEGTYEVQILMPYVTGHT